MNNEKQFIDFKKEVEKLKEIDGAEEYAKQLAHLFLGNGLSLQTILLMAIDFGQQHPHWIPVEKNQLPPKIEGEEITEYYWVAGLNGRWYDVLRYDYRDGRWSDHYGNYHACVTHWMEFQPPRKED